MGCRLRTTRSCRRGGGDDAVGQKVFKICMSRDNVVDLSAQNFVQFKRALEIQNAMEMTFSSASSRSFHRVRVFEPSTAASTSHDFGQDVGKCHGRHRRSDHGGAGGGGVRILIRTSAAKSRVPASPYAIQRTYTCIYNHNVTPWRRLRPLSWQSLRISGPASSFSARRSTQPPTVGRQPAGGGHKTQGIMGGCGLQSQGGAAHKRCCAQEDVPKVRTKKKMRVQHGTLTHKTQGQQGQANQGGAFRSTAGGF